MGFGLLFLGYLLQINFVYAGFTDIFAYLLIFAGITKLSVYNRSFKRARIVLFPLIAVGGVYFVVEVLRFFVTDSDLLKSAGDFISIISLVLVAIFSYFTLSGIEKIAQDTELPRIGARAVRNIFLGSVYYILALILLINHPTINDMNRYLGVPHWLFGLAFMVLNAMLIYSCYMWICLEGEEKMPVKPSRFAFVNRIRQSQDAKEREAHDRARNLAQTKKNKKNKRSK